MLRDKLPHHDRSSRGLGRQPTQVAGLWPAGWLHAVSPFLLEPGDWLLGAELCPLPRGYVEVLTLAPVNVPLLGNRVLAAAHVQVRSLGGPGPPRLGLHGKENAT